MDGYIIVAGKSQSNTHVCGLDELQNDHRANSFLRLINCSFCGVLAVACLLLESREPLLSFAATSRILRPTTSISAYSELVALSYISIKSWKSSIVIRASSPDQKQ